jgi:hypothetical protein
MEWFKHAEKYSAVVVSIKQITDDIIGTLSGSQDDAGRLECLGVLVEKAMALNKDMRDAYEAEFNRGV